MSFSSDAGSNVVRNLRRAIQFIFASACENMPIFDHRRFEEEEQKFAFSWSTTDGRYLSVESTNAFLKVHAWRGYNDNPDFVHVIQSPWDDALPDEPDYDQEQQYMSLLSAVADARAWFIRHRVDRSENQRRLREIFYIIPSTEVHESNGSTFIKLLRCMLALAISGAHENMPLPTFCGDAFGTPWEMRWEPLGEDSSEDSEAQEGDEQELEVKFLTMTTSRSSFKVESDSSAEGCGNVHTDGSRTVFNAMLSAGTRASDYDCTSSPFFGPVSTESLDAAACYLRNWFSTHELRFPDSMTWLTYEMEFFDE